MNANTDQELVCGINAVREIISIRPKSVVELLIKDEKKNTRIDSVASLAKEHRIEIIIKTDNFFEDNLQ